MKTTASSAAGTLTTHVVGNSLGHTTGLISLVLCREAGVNYLNRAAATVRLLPPVLRVRIDWERFALEVLYALPAPGFLLALHQALLAAGAADGGFPPRATAGTG